MDFKLSDHHQMLADSLQRLLADSSDIEKRNRVAEAYPFHDAETWAALVEMGVPGAFFGEEAGGFDGSPEVISVIFEEIGRALSVEPLLGNLLGARVLAAAGCHILAAGVAEGSKRAALAFAEPGVATDLSCIAAEARDTADGWRLNGRKTAIYGGPGADLVVIAARFEGNLALYLVEDPELIGAPMVDGGGIADLVMEDLPARLVMIDASDAVAQALDLGRIALCAESLGVQARLIDMTIDYLKQRQQFGRPLASFQALQHRVVDMVMHNEQCRSITIAAIAAFDTEDRPRITAMAKRMVGNSGIAIAEEAIQLHGGIGMTWEYPATHYAKRLVMIDHQLGDRDDQLVRLLAMQHVQAAT